MQHGCSPAQAVGLQGSVAMEVHEHTRTPEVCGQRGSTNRANLHVFVRRSFAEFCGVSGRYVRVAGIAVLMGRKYENDIHIT